MKASYLWCTIFLLIAPALTIKESELGVNDWTLKQIGQITNLQFFNVHPASNIVYFESELGIFGHLDKSSGKILKREQALTGQKIIESTENQIILWTSVNQLLKFNKKTLARNTLNKFIDHAAIDIHSYFLKDGLQVFGTPSKIMYEASTNVQPDRQIAVPEGTINAKVFKYEDNVYAGLWDVDSHEFCVYSVDFQAQKLSKEACVLAENFELESFRSHINKEIFFQWSSKAYHLKFIEGQIKFVQLDSRIIQLLRNGYVRLENKKTYNPAFQSAESIFRVYSNHNSIQAIAEIEAQKLVIYEQSSTSLTKNTLAHISFSNNNGQVKSQIQRIWINFMTDIEIEVYVQFNDLEITKYQIVSSGIDTKKGQQQWNREQSLAYINKVLFMKYEGYVDHLNNPYHMKLDSREYRNLGLVEKMALMPTLFILRIKAEIHDIIEQLIEKSQDLISLPLKLTSIDTIKNFFKSEMDEYTEKRYGLRKYMIAITQRQNIFAIDTKTADILWKKKIHPNRQLVSLIKLKKEYEREIAISVTFSSGVTYLQQIQATGTFQQLGQFQTEIAPAIHKISDHSILIRSGSTIQQFDINKQLIGQKKTYYFYEIYEESQKIVGWKNVENRLVQTWQLQIPHKQKIIGSSSAYRGESEAKIPLSNQKRVIFKNVDFTNLAVLTSERNETTIGPIKSGTIVLYIINGLTGNIQFAQYQTGVHLGLPVNLVYDENNVIVSYYNSRNRVYQFWTVESYQLPLESELLSKPYQPLINREDITFRSKVYGTTIHIHSIDVSQSKEALLKRNIFIITKEMRIYLLNRDLISSRRPKSAEPTQIAEQEAEYVNVKYPIDNYILPIDPKSFLSQGSPLLSLSKLRLSSTDLQSTIIVYAYGIDSFLIRIAPDRSFDMLARGFNYLQVIGVLVIVTTIGAYFRAKLKEAKRKKPHTE